MDATIPVAQENPTTYEATNANDREEYRDAATARSKRIATVERLTMAGRFFMV
jgi:hypothetical protein